MKCANCQRDYDPSLKQCPHCQTETPGASPYQKPSTVCKNCQTPLKPTDQYCPSCGFDQKKSIIRQTQTGKVTRFVGPMIGLFAFLLLVALSLGAAYYFISQANSDEAIRAESVTVVSRSTNETIAKLKENPDHDLSESDWNSLRDLLSRDDYSKRMAEALKEIRSGDLTIATGAKTLKYIPTHRLQIVPVPVLIEAGETPYTVQIGEGPAWEVKANTGVNITVVPGLYTVTYQPAEGAAMSEEVEISHHSHRYQNDQITLTPKIGSVLPTLKSNFASAKIMIDGQNSHLTMKDVNRRPELLGIHPPGTKYQLVIDTPLGQVQSLEAVQAEGPISFELQNGIVLAKAQSDDLVFVNGEKVGSYRDFLVSDYIVGPIELGKDVVRLQGEGTDQTPFEKKISESLGGKVVEIELSDELKGELISATRRFTMDSFESLKQKKMDVFTNVVPGSEMELRLKDSLELFIQSKDKLDYVPFAIRFDNESFRVYAKDGRAYAEFIESYFIKYVESGFQNHTSWLKKAVYDEAQDKWLFYEDEMLYDYIIPDDNTLTML